MDSVKKGDYWLWNLPGLPDKAVPVGTVIRVTEDRGPGIGADADSRGFYGEVVSVPEPEPEIAEPRQGRQGSDRRTGECVMERVVDREFYGVFFVRTSAPQDALAESAVGGWATSEKGDYQVPGPWFKSESDAKAHARRMIDLKIARRASVVKLIEQVRPAESFDVTAYK